MKLTRYTHSCVRLESAGRTLVIDPGTLSERGALAGVRAVLVTHEHGDHVDADALRDAAMDNPGLRVWGPASLAAALGDLLTVVAPGDTFEADGFIVRTFGGQHAVIHPEIPRVDNNGYLVNDLLYHPGDSFVVPDAAVETLLVPVHAPWLKLSEAVDFVRAVKPRRAHPIHDGAVTAYARDLTDGLLARLGHTDYNRVAVGESVQLF